MRKLIALILIILLLAGMTTTAFADRSKLNLPRVFDKQTEKTERLDPKIEGMLAWAVETAEDDSHGYSQKDRLGPNYDCTSFVSTALMEGGFRLDHLLSTYTMVSELPDYGFKVYRRGETEPQRGDILVRQGSHAEICMGEGGCVAAHKDYDGRSGDRSGHEIEYRGSGDECWYCPFCDSAEYEWIIRYEPELPVPAISAELCFVEITK